VAIRRRGRHVAHRHVGAERVVPRVVGPAAREHRLAELERGRVVEVDLVLEVPQVRNVVVRARPEVERVAQC